MSLSIMNFQAASLKLNILKKNKKNHVEFRRTGTKSIGN